MPEQARQAVEAQAADAAEQLAVSSAAAAAKRELASRAFASDIEAKRAKRAAARAARPESTAEGQPLLDDDAPRPTPLSDAHVVRIAGSSVDAAWYDAPSHSYTSLDDARAAGLWTYPSTPRERARCAVFAELHARGYFMGNGLKFGCHFLVYPGPSAPTSRADGAGAPPDAVSGRRRALVYALPLAVTAEPRQTARTRARSSSSSPNGHLDASPLLS